MKLQKDGKVIDLINPDHIAAFTSEGWTECTEEAADEQSAPAPKKRKTTAKK